ncbi:MAG: OmpH family outer membrane protein [Dysgonamonadaceae bacterium]|jgi:outer membrane protein|nr:OmpH family outer membrane protein [Dysgonamonadaceae bacterium]
MKNNYSYLINGVLAVAIIVLFILFFTKNGQGSGSGKNLTFANDSSITLPVAYVNVDSLLPNYNFAKDLNESLMRREESSRAALNQKEREFNAAAQEFQRKLQNNAFLSEERAKQEQQRIVKMQEDYQTTAQRLAQEFALEQQKLNLQLNDTIKTQLAIFNSTKGFQIILSNTSSDNILYANEKYNITDEVIEYLNKKYGPATAATTTTTEAAPKK